MCRFLSASQSLVRVETERAAVHVDEFALFDIGRVVNAIGGNVASLALGRWVWV
jgi:hypothetical protein